MGMLPRDLTTHPALHDAAAELGDAVLRDLAAAYNQARLRLESLQRDADDAEAFATAVRSGAITTEPRAWADALAYRQLSRLSIDSARAKVKTSHLAWLKRLHALVRRAGEQLAPGVADAGNRMIKLQRQQGQLFGEDPLKRAPLQAAANAIAAESAADRARLEQLGLVLLVCQAAAAQYGTDLASVKLSAPLDAVQPAIAVLVDT